MPAAGSPPTLAALIVLGARLNPRGEPGRVAQLRLRHALNLWREHQSRLPGPAHRRPTARHRHFGGPGHGQVVSRLDPG